MNKTKLDYVITQFLLKKQSDSHTYIENQNDRKERQEYYSSFDENKILTMKEEDLYEYISKLWSIMQHLCRHSPILIKRMSIDIKRGADLCVAE